MPGVLASYLIETRMAGYLSWISLNNLMYKMILSFDTFQTTPNSLAAKLMIG